MTAAAVLAECRRRGLMLTANGDRVRVAGPERDVSELRAALTAHKAAILAFLSGGAEAIAGPSEGRPAAAAGGPEAGRVAVRPARSGRRAGAPDGPAGCGRCGRVRRPARSRAGRPRAVPARRPALAGQGRRPAPARAPSREAGRKLQGSLPSRRPRRGPLGIDRPDPVAPARDPRPGESCAPCGRTAGSGPARRPESRPRASAPRGRSGDEATPEFVRACRRRDGSSPPSARWLRPDVPDLGHGTIAGPISPKWSAPAVVRLEAAPPASRATPICPRPAPGRALDTPAFPSPLADLAADEAAEDSLPIGPVGQMSPLRPRPGWPPPRPICPACRGPGPRTPFTPG
jgi:hypothetical protein